MIVHIALAVLVVLPLFPLSFLIPLVLRVRYVLRFFLFRNPPFLSFFSSSKSLVFFPAFYRAARPRQGSAMNSGWRLRPVTAAPCGSQDWPPFRGISERKDSFEMEEIAMQKTNETGRQDLYTRITAQIVASLENGVRPWVKHWNAEHAAGSITRPLRHNGQPYSGINVISLWASAFASYVRVRNGRRRLTFSMPRN
jgi:N-terminal domain of anti-restriction factor ArdC